MSLNIKEKISFNLLNILLESNYQRLNKLYQKYNSWSKILQNTDYDSLKYDPEKEYKKLENNKIKLILKDEEKYPRLLKEIPLAPYGIYVLGNENILNQKTIAIVGTRKATAEGKLIAKKFAEELSRYNLNIASGLALGIDSAAHLGALENNGKTIAILGNGLLNIYPATNKNLAEKIINSNGAIISEYNIYAASLPYRFLERNRIISGLSLGVLIIEAPQESGALNTARFASDQNREVWVVPGSIFNSNFLGSHKLIQNGASLVINPKDILLDLNIEINNFQNQNLNLSKEEKFVYTTIKNYGQPINIDKIIEITNLKTQMVSQIISLLLIKNLIKEINQGYIVNL
ncbi:MAG: DNA-processing protein DprA [Minisyncoccia bacterium]